MKLDRRPRRRTGLCYALTEDGVELPVVDITNPAFACAPRAAELAAVEERSRRGLERSRRLPRFVLRLLARRSVVMRGVLGAGGSHVGGMLTYLFKLGPDNLPRGYGDRLDRQMLGAIGPLACRLRLRETARQLADALAPPAAAHGGPLWIVDIGGGVAADAFNALILLRRERPALLEGREAHILVLDIDGQGPAFGARAVAALRGAGGPLAGLAVDLAHRRCDWSDASTLAATLGRLGPRAVAVGSSEGGLFEYGADDAVRSCLATIREAAPAVLALVGSLVRDDRLQWLTRGPGAPGLRPRGLESFGALVRDVGWSVERVCSDPMYHVVTLRPAG